jgi:signal transduction histidine kinase
MSSVDTRRLVEEVLAIQRHSMREEAAKRVTVELEGLPTVQADPLLLRQVFANLLSNAFKSPARRANRLQSDGPARG